MKLQIEKLVYGGAGLAHVPEEPAGRLMLVPFTLPGETVEAEPLQKTSGEAALVQVLEASAKRVVPHCVHFGACGGCQLQHGRYEAQSQSKIGMLRDALEQAGVTAIPKIQPHTAEEWGYRNRIRLRVMATDTEVKLGYNRRGGNEFLPIRECPIAGPMLWRAASAVLMLSRANAAIQRWLRVAIEIEFFATGDESAMQMTVFVRKGLLTGFDEFCKKIRSLVPELVGAGVSILSKEGTQKTRRAERPRAGVSWGNGGLHYEAAGRRYWVSRGGFFQVNRFLIEEMVRLVAQGRKGQLAWDLYAGVGLFSRALKDSFETVVAVEGSEIAASDLAGGFKGEGRRVVWASTLDFLKGAVIQRERPELIVADPPRTGLGLEICSLLGRLKAAEMVYVSCDPVTLSRDLRVLVDSGYKLVELHMVDMFPQTFHIETVVVLRR